eukprot:TRINITY_DN2236_c0_g1_i1.p2 TRINITY_DN2236_c0_g1~~TRINITY_DN2236_c0_g1_i1.p2  ORF type:complete len:102 (+),score=42.85 TRINITY_DN2236_c0_g1_i1:208-513(+)
MAQWNFLRVKREKQTIFLVCEPSDTVDHAKSKLSHILAQQGTEIPAENIKLLLEETKEALEEGKTLADGKAEGGAVLYMVFKKPDTEDEWEDISIASPAEE